MSDTMSDHTDLIARLRQAAARKWPNPDVARLPAPEVLGDVMDLRCPQCDTHLRVAPPIKLGYTADQMLEWGEAIRQQERERWLKALSAARSCAQANINRADDCGRLARALLDAIRAMSEAP